MTDMMNYIKLAGLDVGVSELADLTDEFTRKGMSIETAQKMAIETRIAELKQDEKQIEEAIKNQRG